MATVAIIGGGISGLAAGIYAQMSGLDSVIYESLPVVGGQCVAWKRKGFTIDNCVHWLTGTNPTKELYQVWQDVGVLGDELPVIKHDYFLKITMNGKSVHVWRDVDAMERELLEVAPEDAKEITNFMKAIRRFQALEVPSRKPKEQMNVFDTLNLVRKMLPVIPVAAQYGKLSLDDFAQRFKNPLLQQLVYNYLPKQYYALATIFMYAMFTMGNADLPLGGSEVISRRMRDTYLSRGGTISCKKKASQFEVEGSRITKIHFEDGSTASADYIICACDPSVTFSLLGTQHTDELFSQWYANTKDYPVFSELNIYYAFDCPIDSLPMMELFHGKPYEVAGRTHTLIVTNTYSDEPGFAPEGKGIMQVLIEQTEEDYAYWNHLYETDRDAYKNEKNRIAEDVRIRLETQYPEYAGKMSAIEIVTPQSFHRFTGAYKGSYMGFIQTPQVKKVVHTGRIASLDNCILAGQWLQTPGGLPNAVITGRFSVQRLLRMANMSKSFCSHR